MIMGFSKFIFVGFFLDLFSGGDTVWDVCVFPSQLRLRCSIEIVKVILIGCFTYWEQSGGFTFHFYQYPI